MSELRSRTIRLAAELEPGSRGRRALLGLLTAARTAARLPAVLMGLGAEADPADPRDAAGDLAEALEQATEETTRALAERCWQRMQWKAQGKDLTSGLWETEDHGGDTIYHAWEVRFPSVVVGKLTIKSPVSKRLVKAVLADRTVMRLFSPGQVSRAVGDRGVQQWLSRIVVSALREYLEGLPESIPDPGRGVEGRIRDVAWAGVDGETESVYADDSEPESYDEEFAKFKTNIIRRGSKVLKAEVTGGQVVVGFQVTYDVDVEGLDPYNWLYDRYT